MADTSRATVLVVDDDDAHRLMLSTLISDWGFKAFEAQNGAVAVSMVRDRAPDLVLMDVRMPDLDGISATRRIHQHNPAVPIVIMTAYSSVPSAVEALKAGAFDYLTKPLDFDTLRLTLRRAMEHVELRRENESLRQQLARFQVPDLVGRSDAIRKLLEMIAMVAPTEAAVLVTGESGTGKGIVARAIHAHSPRREKPLVEVNCAAIPDNLVESELFGHEKGAFTGAEKKREGRFFLANRGTIFLDEIGELSLPMQAKLLRVLQEKDIQRVGSDHSIPVDVRVLAATNRDLEAMIRDNTFREDLYYRLNVIQLEVPPLRQRLEDIPVLAEHFVRRFAEKNRKRIKGLTPRAMDALLRHPWPGNVRELENVVERAVILAWTDYITEDELPDPIRRTVTAEPSANAPDVDRFPPGGSMSLADLEKKFVLATLEACQGNKSEAARRLGISRKTLKMKLRRYEEESTAESIGP